MTVTVFLIRHSAVAVPPGTCYGRSDVPLAGPVEPLARQLLARLPDSFTLFSSPATRCLSLARQLGHATVDTRFREIDFGAWELLPYASIDRNLIDAWAADPLNFCAHGGESVARMALRVCAALDEARASSPQPLVIVSHGGPLRVMAGHLRGLPAEQWMSLAFDYGSLTRLDV